MHQKCEHEINSKDNHNATMTSCISQTDSVNGNVAIAHDINRATMNNTTTTSAEATNQQEKLFSKPDKRTNGYNIEYINNLTKGSNVNSEAIHAHDRGEQRQFPQQFPPHSVSPTVSVRSTTISIVSIDANAIDSSVVDSDSDCEADAEGIHSNYVVKKLGQQTTYAPDSPNLPIINKGLKVISQTINQNDNNGLATDSLPAQILNGGLCRPTTTLDNNSTSQIGSIALTNSTDVTFGDKHFYEGPVTIQQFLIDSRDKWKPMDDDGQDNPIFTDEHIRKETEQDAAAKVNSTSAQSNLPYKFIFNRKAVVITGTIILLTILVGILIAVVNKLPQTVGKNDDDSDAITNGTLVFVSREEWGARPVTGILTKLQLPVHRVVISHTASDFCHTKEVCIMRLKVAQNFHMDSWGWDDIGYNFLIGSDGRVYVGRGWDDQGAHTKGYNTDSVGVSFIGTYSTTQPTEQQITAAKLLLEEGVRLQKLVPNYRVYGARQLSATQSPGDAIYNIIKTWSHWSDQI